MIFLLFRAIVFSVRVVIVSNVHETVLVPGVANVGSSGQAKIPSWKSQSIFARVLTFLKLKSESDLSAKASTWSSTKTRVETALPKCEKLMEKVRFFERNSKNSERVAFFGISAWIWQLSMAAPQAAAAKAIIKLSGERPLQVPPENQQR